jgi:hypothetical protein
MQNLTRDTIFIQGRIKNEECCVCSFDDLGVAAIWNEQVQMLKAYKVLRDYTSKLHVCFDCIEAFINEEGGKLKNRTDLMYLFPSLIESVCDDDKESFSYVTQDVIKEVRELRRMDNELKSASLACETKTAWWQGATGDDVNLFNKLIEAMYKSPESFLETDVVSYVKMKCGIADHLVLSPAVHAAERFRQSHLKTMMAKRDKCSFLQVAENIYSL